MIRLAADENFNGEIVRGLVRRESGLDIVRIQDWGLLGADDPTVLEWAAAEGRILLTHDRATMPAFAYRRVRAGLTMPGVFVLSNRLSVARAIEDVLLVSIKSEAFEWEGIVLYLPL